MCDKHVAPFTVSTRTLKGLGSWSWSFYEKEMMLRGDKTQMVLGIFCLCILRSDWEVVYKTQIYIIHCLFGIKKINSVR